ncbi:hypothetical protein HHI36_002461, partial [Cryptolaemus montrouzieri]
FSGSYVTDRPVPSSHNIAGSSTTDEGTLSVPSTSITRPSISSSTVDKDSIPDTHIVSETPMQNPTTIIDQATAATSSRTRSSSTECESPSVIDDVSNFLYEAASREHLKTPENVRPPETEILLDLTHLSNLNMSSTSFATSEEIRPFPKAAPRLENRRSIRKRKSTIYTVTPEKENLMEMKQKQKREYKGKEKGKGKGQAKGKGKGKGKEKYDTGERNADDAIDSDCRDDDDTIRLDCTESYADSIPGEQWVQCIICKLWAHSKCIS